MRARLAVVGVILAVAAGAPASASAAPAFQASACPADTFPEDVDVDCGFITVPENRAQPQGRQITVAAALVHAAAQDPKPDPIVFVDGGPSFGAISSYALDAYFAGASYIEDRDLILVDTRGTGTSQPRLGCPELDAAGVASSYSKPFVDSDFAELLSGATADCRDRLTGDGIDLSAYNSAESAGDLDDLRQALGYDRWNVIAFSADGILGLTYMRLYPAGIRSVILDSAQSTQMLGPLDYARGYRQQLERVFSGCAADTACNAAYPQIRALFYDLVHRLDRHPVHVPIPWFAPHPITLRVDGIWVYNDAVSGIFPGDRFEPEHIHDLLADIWRQTHGEFAAVQREQLGTGPFEDSSDAFIAQGKTLSYMCHDNVGFITSTDLQQAAQDLPELASDILSPDYSLPKSVAGIGPAACRIWNVGLAAPAQNQPVSSAIPTLVLAGEYDQGVPPNIVRQIPPTLPNSFFYEVPAGAHGQLADYNTASPCMREIAAQFLENPTARPDDGCFAALPAFDFTPPH
jgi:pimeloyl-ACP methyl ester carboxylesterase